MVKMFSRRDFLKTASLVAAGGVLAACAPQATATPGAAEVKPAETKPAVAPPVAAGGKILSYWFAWCSLGRNAETPRV
jgi:nitrous oxide reductase